jgi:chromosome partitioning protein
MWKIISFFNHKWGVGKTTLVHNLAFALADEWKKVLVIDTDPQMNLTAAIYGLTTSVDYSTNDKSIWMKNVEKYISVVDYFDAILGRTKSDRGNAERYSVAWLTNGRIDMISGQINISDYEAELYFLITNNIVTQAAKTYVGSIATAIRKETELYDFILLDTSPSSTSMMNAVLITMSDYMIAPVTPNFFSLQAIDNLAEVFRNWRKRLDNVIRLNSDLNWLEQRVKVLGIIVQMSKRFNGGWQHNMDGFSQATEKWIWDLNDSILRFAQSAIPLNTIVDRDEFRRVFPTKEPFIIEKCCDFTPKLKSVAESSGVPIIHVTEEMCKAYSKKEKTPISIESPDGQYTKAFNYINTQYRSIAHNLLNIL